MQSPVYLLCWVSGLCALWLIWNYGIKRLFLDLLRERLFELRFELFKMGSEGVLPFNDDSYRAFEMLLNGLLRFAHRVSFVVYILSKIDDEKAKKDSDYVDVSNQLALKLSRLDQGTRERLALIISSARTAIILYMVFSSLFFALLVSALVISQRIGLTRLRGVKAQLTSVIEREAYRSESRRHFKHAVA
jgi:hypothetical protein